jgi:membrane protease YdiL (CAAX protease family)
MLEIMNNIHSDKAEVFGIRRRSLATLIFNQTIGILGLWSLIFLCLHTEKGKLFSSRFQITTDIIEWLKSKLYGFSPWDISVAIAVVLLMACWNIFQQTFITRKIISNSEFEPSTKIQKAGSIYLILTTAFGEEIIFRGIILPAVSFYLLPVGGLLVSSVLFGIIHFEKGLQGQIAITVYGFIFGSAILLGASLWACIMAHVINNSIAFLVPKNSILRSGKFLSTTNCK